MILSLEGPNYCLPANIQQGCQWWTDCRVLPTRRCNVSHFKCQHARNWKYFKDRSISKNLWPPRSPDPTPADFFLWGLLKSKVYKNTPRTIGQPKDAVRQETEDVIFNTLGTVFRNLEKRIQVCLDVKGDLFQHRLWAGPVLHRSRYVYINFQVIVSIP